MSDPFQDLKQSLRPVERRKTHSPEVENWLIRWPTSTSPWWWVSVRPNQGCLPTEKGGPHRTREEAMEHQP